MAILFEPKFEVVAMVIILNNYIIVCYYGNHFESRTVVAMVLGRLVPKLMVRES